MARQNGPQTPLPYAIPVDSLTYISAYILRLKPENKPNSNFTIGREVQNGDSREVQNSSLLLHCYWLGWTIQPLEEVRPVGFSKASSNSVNRLWDDTIFWSLSMMAKHEELREYCHYHYTNRLCHRAKLNRGWFISLRTPATKDQLVLTRLQVN